MRPSYKYIATQLQRGKVIPFLGAAASSAGTSVKSAQELTQDLIELSGYPEEEDRTLTKVAQYHEECVAGRTPLYNYLRATFYVSHRDGTPSLVAKLLADVKCPHIVTTNYDPLVERAFELAGHPYVVVTHITNRSHEKWGYVLVQRSEQATEVQEIHPKDFVMGDYKNQTIIYKIHGTFGGADLLGPEVDTIVVTENDYVDFMVMIQQQKLPNALVRDFQQKHFLFLGYSLTDWNFRVILRRIQIEAELGKDYRSWAIQHKPSMTDQRFWAKRNVEVYDVDLDEFVAGVRAEYTSPDEAK